MNAMVAQLILSRVRLGPQTWPWRYRMSQGSPQTGVGNVHVPKPVGSQDPARKGKPLPKAKPTKSAGKPKR